ncbi:MAG: hypothetical protein K2L02_00605, partial [Clostridia bacterium]|nr:hypothetical protein [Clostridia bacterium]
MKKYDENKKYGKMIALIVFLVCVFVLIVAAIIVQSDGEGLFEGVAPEIGYLLLALMILLPILILFLIISTFKKKGCDTHLT